MGKKISIIVPVYNSEDTVSSCINSILNQSYKNIEIIAVDDGSKDNSFKILKQIQQEDKRLKIIKTDNCGVSNARNVGMKVANGEYIGFVDSDDMIEVDMYEILYKNIIKYKADISICGYIIKENNKEDIYYNSTNEKNFYNQKEIIEQLLNDTTFGGGVWNKLFRKSICENIKFNLNYKINEDRLFLLECILVSNRFIYEDVCKYYYIKRENSATTKKISANNKKLFEIVKVNEIIRQKIEEKYDDLECYISKNELVSTINLYRSITLSGSTNELKNELLDLRNILKKINYKDIKKSINIVYRIEYNMIKYFNIIYTCFIKLLYTDLIRKIRKIILRR